MEIEAVACNFLACHTKGWRELAEYAIHGINRNFPNAEEAQHVVDAVGVEILRHLAEALFPPQAAVGYHLFPVVGGESPVLTVGGERIGWCASLAVEVEIAWLYPCLHTVAADADWNVAFEDYAFLACIFVRTSHLLVEDKLHEVPERHFLVFACAAVCHRLTLAFIEGVVIGPVAECGSAVKVAVVAECRIRHEPVFIVVEECLKRLGAHHLCAVLLKELTQIASLGGIHSLIVDLRERVEFVLECGVIARTLFVLKLWKLANIDEHWVQRIDADALVGIGVQPCVGDGCIIDREHLKRTLTGGNHPVDHLFEVAEVAHTKTAFAAERENRYHGTSHTPIGQVEFRFVELVNHSVALLQLRQHHGAVVAFFPHHFGGVGLIYCHKLKLQHA